MTTIPASYESSRERFRARLKTIRAHWSNAQLMSRPLEDDLTMDWIHAEPLKTKEKLVVISTAQHGIEGYVGSAMLELFIEEFLPRLDPQTTGVLLIHAINPWGMKHRKRNNTNNVDLNRNFTDDDFASLKNVNADYPSLNWFLNPPKAVTNLILDRINFAGQTLHALVTYGVKRIREASLMGQYRFPQGIYFGGTELQPETKVLMNLYRAAYQDYRTIIHLDLHTGYGPRTQMTVVTSPQEKMTADETSRKYHVPLVAAANPDDFYTMHGDMIDWEYLLVGNKAHYFGATCEFGTFGEGILPGARSLQITILKNRTNQFGAIASAQSWIDREYGELYLPSEPAWFEKAKADVRATFNSILGAEGFLS
ncbi:MAG: M14 family metallopeptidase [Anaerolineales bacterium]|nr:M14 family metallopeptidase [Anaerolineales bacterium]